MGDTSLVDPPRRRRGLAISAPQAARPGRRAFYGMAVQHAVFGLLPVLFTGWLLATVLHRRILAIDFHRQYWIVGDRILHGLRPYDPSWMHLKAGIGFPYSAFDALVFTPFALIPHRVADVVFAGLAIAALMLTLRVLGVRDWRLYGLVLLWAPVVSAWQTGNLTLLLGLGIAAAWRFRDRPIVVGGLLALLATAKLFLWPLGLWLLATRRYTALAWAVVWGVGLNVVSWAVIGFDQFAPYTRLLHAIAKMDEPRSYSLIALGLNNGAGHFAARAVTYSVCAAVAVCCLVLGRRGRDTSALILALAVCLLAAPVIWLHYFALLAVPLALTHPRLGLVWLLPLVMVLGPVHEPSTAQLLAALLIATAVFVVTVRREATAPTENRAARAGA
jgi:hypothetical protein